MLAKQLGLDGDLAIVGPRSLGGSYPVSQFAAAAVGATALALADLVVSSSLRCFFLVLLNDGHARHFACAF